MEELASQPTGTVWSDRLQQGCRVKGRSSGWVGPPETGSAHTSPWCPRVTFQGLWDFAAGGQLCLELRVTPELDKQVGAAPYGDWKGDGGVLGT